MLKFSKPPNILGQCLVVPIQTKIVLGLPIGELHLRARLDHAALSDVHVSSIRVGTPGSFGSLISPNSSAKKTTIPELWHHDFGVHKNYRTKSPSFSVTSNSEGRGVRSAAPRLES